MSGDGSYGFEDLGRDVLGTAEDEEVLADRFNVAGGRHAERQAAETSRDVARPTDGWEPGTFPDLEAKYALEDAQRAVEEAGNAVVRAADPWDQPNRHPGPSVPNEDGLREAVEDIGRGIQDAVEDFVEQIPDWPVPPPLVSEAEPDVEPESDPWAEYDA